mgnify:FL=1
MEDINIDTPTSETAPEGTATVETGADTFGAPDTAGAPSESTGGQSDVLAQALNKFIGEVGEDAISIEALASADFGEDEVMTGTHKGLPHYDEILRHLPENGKKLIQNLRSNYTQKTQVIAEMKKELETERMKFHAQRKLLTESEFAKEMERLAADNTKHDVWDEEGRRKHIEQETAKRLNQMLEPLKREVAQQKRELELKDFKVRNPEIVEPEVRVKVARLLLDRPNLSLEDAYYITKAQMTTEENSRLTERMKAKRQASRQALSKTSTGRNVNTSQVPKFKDAWSAYQYHKSQTDKI